MPKGGQLQHDLCQIDSDKWIAQHYRPMAGGFCTMERSKQISTKTAKPPATTITLPNLCIFLGQFRGRAFQPS